MIGETWIVLALKSLLTSRRRNETLPSTSLLLHAAAATPDVDDCDANTLRSSTSINVLATIDYVAGTCHWLLHAPRCCGPRSPHSLRLAIDGTQDQLLLEDNSKEVECRIGWTLLEFRLRPFRIDFCTVVSEREALSFVSVVVRDRVLHDRLKIRAGSGLIQ